MIITNGVRDIGESAFNRCHGLTNVTMGINVANIGENAFWDCKTLSGRLTIPNSVTNIGASAFRYCSELSGVTIGSGVASIGLQAFDCCGKLASVTIPDGVKDIDGEAFGHCEGLTSFVISGTVTNLGERVLVQCTSLRAVYFLGNAPAVGGNIYELTSAGLTTYVPEDSTGWQAPGSSVLPAKWPAGDNGRNIACGTPVFSPFTGISFNASGKPELWFQSFNPDVSGVSLSILSTTNLLDWAHAVEFHIPGPPFNFDSMPINHTDTAPARFYKLKASEQPIN